MMNDNIFPVNLSNYNNSAIFNWTTPYLNETLNISSSDLTRQMAFMLNSTLSGAIQIYPFLDSVAQDHGAEAVGYNVLAGNFSTEEVAYPALNTSVTDNVGEVGRVDHIWSSVQPPVAAEGPLG
eukprot:gene9662-8485_t